MVAHSAIGSGCVAPQNVEVIYLTPAQLNKQNNSTGLPAYSDTGYSDILDIVTLFWSIKGSPCTENPSYSDILLTVTLFGRPNTVTVSGKACTVNWPETRGTEPFIRVGQAIIPRKKEVWAFI